MIKEVIGVPTNYVVEPNRSIIVPVPFSDVHQNDNPISFGDENGLVRVFSVVGIFDKVLTKKGFDNIIETVRKTSKDIFIPSDVAVGSYEFKCFLSELNELSQQVTLYLASKRLLDIVKDLQSNYFNAGETDESILIIDLHNFLHRSYHAMPKMYSQNGEPTSVLKGLSVLLKWALGRRYTHLVFCSESQQNLRSAYTLNLYEGDMSKAYKGTRKSAEPELRAQIEICENFLSNIGLPPIKVQGYEADDVISSIVDRFKDRTVHLFSGDKDFCQLFTYPHFRLLDLNTKKALDHNYVLDKFGITADKFIDYQALIGDATDNVSGIPGIGPKTAVNLLNEYGSLINILNNADSIKGATGTKIKEGRELAMLSQDLVYMRRNLMTSLKLNDIRKDRVNIEAIPLFLSHYNISY